MNGEPKKKEVFTFDHDGAGTGKPTTSVSSSSLFFLMCVSFYILVSFVLPVDKGEQQQQQYAY